MRYIKTEAGKQAIIDRSSAITPRQRSALIIVNGERTLDVLLKMVEGLGVTMSDLSRMEEQGFIAKIAEDKNTLSTLNPTVDAVTSEVSVTQKIAIPIGPVNLLDAQSRYSHAYPLATQLTAKMGLRGFRLNLAVEAAGSYSQLIELFPKIKEAVGAEKALALEKALQGEI
jgi:hypothetical protein